MAGEKHLHFFLSKKRAKTLLSQNFTKFYKVYIVYTVFTKFTKFLQSLQRSDKVCDICLLLHNFTKF